MKVSFTFNLIQFFVNLIGTALIIYAINKQDYIAGIDAIIQYVGSVKGDTRPEYAKGKREFALVYTKLQEAKMWTGKVLEELGSELPIQYQDKA